MNSMATGKLSTQADCTTMPSKRVLVLANEFPVYSETFVADHVAILLAHGVHVAVIARRIDKLAAASLNLHAKELEMQEAPSFSLGSLAILAGIVVRHPHVLANLLLLRCAWHGARLACTPAARLDWDTVHAHFAPNAVSAMFARPDWRTRLVINFHGHDATVTPRRFGWKPYRRILGNTRAIVHSSYIERLVSSNTELDIIRVTMGVDIELFNSPVRGDQWRPPLNLVFVGRLVEQKGAHVALEATARLHALRPDLDVQLSIIGTGPRADALTALANRLGLETRVHSLAAASHVEIAGHLARADVALMPSQIGIDGSQEGFGRVAIEAMACGLPVVACPSGGLAETVGTGGIIAAGFGADHVCDAILQVIDAGTPASWQALARKQAMRFNMRKMAAECLKILDATESGKLR